MCGGETTSILLRRLEHDCLDEQSLPPPRRHAVGVPALIAATAGMRRSEGLALRWSDVASTLALRRIRRGKTGTARRMIHIPKSTVVALRTHRKMQAEQRLVCGAGWLDNDLVVDRGDGEPVIPASLSAGFARIADSVGLGDVRLHDPTRVCRGVATGRREREARQRGLGHSRASFTLDVDMHVLPGMGSRSPRRPRSHWRRGKVIDDEVLRAMRQYAGWVVVDVLDEPAADGQAILRIQSLDGTQETLVTSQVALFGLED